MMNSFGEAQVNSYVNKYLPSKKHPSIEVEQVPAYKYFTYKTTNMVRDQEERN